MVMVANTYNLVLGWQHRACGLE